MKNISNSKLLLVMAALVLSAGCSFESALKDKDTSASRIVPVRIGTFAAVGEIMNGVRLNSIRIIAVDESGIVAFNRSAGDGYLEFIDNNDDATAGNFHVGLYPGSYDFYVIINEGSASLTAELNAIYRISDLEKIKIGATDISGMTEESMICVGIVRDVQVRDADDNDTTTPNPGEVNYGEEGWIDKLNVQVHRAAAKLTVNIRKNTDNPTDAFTITGATLSRVPEYSYVIPQNYAGAFTELTPDLTNDVEFVANQAAGDYNTVVEAYIMPEYLMSNRGDMTKLSIVADYTVAGGIFRGEVEYSMPLLGDGTGSQSGPEYDDIVRNKHYRLNITISQRGEFEYTPYIEYEVGDWDVVSDGGSVDISDVINATGAWAAGTRFEDAGAVRPNIVLVGFRGSATMNFQLNNPEGAQWRAYLTNDMDFELAGITQGSTRDSFDNPIVIRPVREFDSDNITTELYILISNVTSEEEWDLNRDESTGLGHRYVIKYER